MSKLAIVMTGGGMRCSYGAGVLRALSEEYNLTQPTILVAGSGSAGIAAYYLANQTQEMISIWEKELSSEKFFDIKRVRKMMDIDYLVDEIFGKKVLLDLKKIHTSPVDFFVPVLNDSTGKVEFFSAKKNTLELLRAAKALPVLYGKHIKLGKASYVDSVLSSTLEPLLEQAIALGATHIIAVDIDDPNLILQSFQEFWLLSQSKKCQKGYHQQEKYFEKYKLPKTIKLVTIKPKKKLPVHLTDIDSTHLKAAVKQGFQETKDSRALRIFLKEIKDSGKKVK